MKSGIVVNFELIKYSQPFKKALGDGQKKLFLRPSLPKICSSPYFLFLKIRSKGHEIHAYG